jgi:protoporphyrinogen IX oxidase
MTETLSVLYIWLKSAHIIFVIFWMAGLFMLPRFFVYHQESAVGSEEAIKWVDRESKLIKIILNPSIIIVWVVGLFLAWNIGAMAEGWFHAKLLFVLGLSGYHGWIVGYAKKARTR